MADGATPEDGRQKSLWDILKLVFPFSPILVPPITLLFAVYYQAYDAGLWFLSGVGAALLIFNRFQSRPAHSPNATHSPDERLNADQLRYLDPPKSEDQKGPLNPQRQLSAYSKTFEAEYQDSLSPAALFLERKLLGIFAELLLWHIEHNTLSDVSKKTDEERLWGVLSARPWFQPQALHCLGSGKLSGLYAYASAMPQLKLVAPADLSPTSRWSPEGMERTSPTALAVSADGWLPLAWARVLLYLLFLNAPGRFHRDVSRQQLLMTASLTALLALAGVFLHLQLSHLETEREVIYSRSGSVVGAGLVSLVGLEQRSQTLARKGTGLWEGQVRLSSDVELPETPKETNPLIAWLISYFLRDTDLHWSVGFHSPVVSDASASSRQGWLTALGGDRLRRDIKTPPRLDEVALYPLLRLAGGQSSERWCEEVSPWLEQRPLLPPQRWALALRGHFPAHQSPTSEEWCGAGPPITHGGLFGTLYAGSHLNQTLQNPSPWTDEKLQALLESWTRPDHPQDANSSPNNAPGASSNTFNAHRALSRASLLVALDTQPALWPATLKALIDPPLWSPLAHLYGLSSIPSWPGSADQAIRARLEHLKNTSSAQPSLIPWIEVALENFKTRNTRSKLTGINETLESRIDLIPELLEVLSYDPRLLDVWFGPGTSSEPRRVPFWLQKLARTGTDEAIRAGIQKQLKLIHQADRRDNASILRLWELDLFHQWALTHPEETRAALGEQHLPLLLQELVLWSAPSLETLKDTSDSTVKSAIDSTADTTTDRTNLSATACTAKFPDCVLPESEWATFRHRILMALARALTRASVGAPLKPAEGSVEQLDLNPEGMGAPYTARARLRRHLDRLDLSLMTALYERERIESSPVPSSAALGKDREAVTLFRRNMQFYLATQVLSEVLLPYFETAALGPELRILLDEYLSTAHHPEAYALRAQASALALARGMATDSTKFDSKMFQHWNTVATDLSDEADPFRVGISEAIRDPRYFLLYYAVPAR